MIPRAVFEGLTVNQVFKEEVKKVRECSFIRVVSVNQESSVKLLQRVTCLDIMRKSGRHISETLYRQLIEKMDQ